MAKVVKTMVRGAEKPQPIYGGFRGKLAKAYDTIVGLFLPGTAREMMQDRMKSAALLSFESLGAEPGDDTVVYFVGIDNARFKRPVGPGDQLILEASVDRVKAGIYRYKTRASVEGLTVVEADLMCTMRKVE